MTADASPVVSATPQFHVKPLTSQPGPLLPPSSGPMSLLVHQRPSPSLPSIKVHPENALPQRAPPEACVTPVTSNFKPGSISSVAASVSAPDSSHLSTETIDSTDTKMDQGPDEPVPYDPLNDEDTSRIPPMGSRFNSRLAFESACRNAIPDTADWSFRIWKSLEVETSRRYGKNAFVELGCRHIDNSKCSSATFRVRAVHNKEGEWVIVKRTLIHDNNGPLGQKKRRGTGRKHKKPTNISTSASTSRSTSRAATPAADDADRKYRAARAGTPDILLGAAETLQQQGPSGVPDGRGTTVGVKRHLEVSKHPTKRAKIPPRFSIPTKMPQVDVPLYCYCNYPAYDEMVACSGTNCQTQYFHAGCINRNDPLVSGWMCFNCRQEAATSALQGTPTAPYVRPADDIVHRHLGVLSIVAAAFSPLKSAPHGPIVAFLNCLNPTLGDTCGEVLYSAGLTCPSRLQDMELREWEAFFEHLRTTDALSAFDLFTLNRTVSHWMIHGYSNINKV